MKRWDRFVLIMVVGGSVLLSGCWDYVEVESLNFVMGVGIDSVEPEFSLTVESIQVLKGGPQAELVPIVVTAQGSTFFQAARNLINPLGERLFWAHALVFIVSEEVARDGLLPAIEFVFRDVDVRTSLWLLITKGCSPLDVFQTDPQLADSVSTHLGTMIDARARNPVFFAQRFWEVDRALAQSGLSLSAPTIQIIQQEDKKIAIIEGTALFTNVKMVGWIDGIESRNFSILMGERVAGPIVVDVDVMKEKGPIAFQVKDNRVRTKPRIEKGRLKIEIEVRLQLELAELGRLRIDFTQPSIIHDLEAQVSRTMEAQFTSLIRRLQVDFNTDSLGLGASVKRTYPQVWREIGENWSELYGTVPVSVRVVSHIIASGVRSKLLPVRD